MIDSIVVDSRNCPKCAAIHECLMLEDAQVILINEGWTSGQLLEIIIDMSPFLQAQFGRPVNTHPVRLERVFDRNKNLWNYIISCPVCGEFTMEYKGVPVGVDVFVGADRGLGKYAVFDFVPDVKRRKSDEVASEILRRDQTKGEG